MKKFNKKTSSSTNTPKAAKKSDAKSVFADIAIYDYNQSYRYSTYWKGREYEHRAEVIALGALLRKAIAHQTHFLAKNSSKMGKPFRRLIDIGAGFGRLYGVYSGYVDTAILGDYSLKELIEATERIKKISKRADTAVFFVGLNAYFMPFKSEIFDIAVSIRVMHHIIDIKRFLQEVFRVLEPGGYFILEVANKNHIKAVVRAILQRNFKFFRLKRIKQKHQPHQSQGVTNVNTQGYIFYNYNINYLTKLAKKTGFEVLAARQVSILRHPFVKKVLPVSVLTTLDAFYQNISRFLTKLGLYLTPSVFLLLHKPRSTALKKRAQVQVGKSSQNIELEDILICPNHRQALSKTSSGYSCPKGDIFKKRGDIVDLRFPPLESIIS